MIGACLMLFASAVDLSATKWVKIGEENFEDIVNLMGIEFECTRVTYQCQRKFLSTDGCALGGTKTEMNCVPLFLEPEI